MIADQARKALAEALGDRIDFDVPMAKHTSLRIGGPADGFATPSSRDELSRLLALCCEHELSHTLLGGGFNTLVTDEGIDGVVISLRKFRDLHAESARRIRAEAGVSHSQVTRFCVNEGLAGLEFGAGIPGTVGGWVVMNAGIGSRELRNVVEAIEIMPAVGGRAVEQAAEESDFEYRALPGLAPGAVVISAALAVTPAEPAVVRAEVDRLLASRSESQPLNIPSCGSVFKNPEGDFAGRLIESVGLKGESRGAAQISPLHANFIANTGGATCADVLALIRFAQDRVESETGVRLHPEVRVIGRGAH